MENSKVCIIIPSYNEGKIIASTLQPLISAGYTIILVDDCSSDDTELVARGLPVHYIRHFINLGQGASLQTGFNYAKKLDIDVVVTFDADGQHDYKDIPAMIAPLVNNEADVVLGTRFKRREDVMAVPSIRRRILKVAIMVNRFFAGIKLSDAHNGFRAVNRHALNNIRLYENRMAHATEFLYNIKKHKLRYVEVPVHIVYTDYSQVKGQSSANSVNILIDLVLNKLFKM